MKNFSSVIPLLSLLISNSDAQDPVAFPDGLTIGPDAGTRLHGSGGWVGLEGDDSLYFWSLKTDTPDDGLVFGAQLFSVHLSTYSTPASEISRFEVLGGEVPSLLFEIDGTEGLARFTDELNLSVDGDLYLDGNLYGGESNEPIFENGKIVAPVEFPSAFSFGNGAVSTGDSSLAFGDSDTQATATYSVALGKSSRAIGGYSVALGFNSDATGGHSFSVGHSNIASGYSSIAMGYQSKSRGRSSFAAGERSQATKQGATAMGETSSATGRASVAIGWRNRASGDYSTSIGFDNQSPKTGSVTIGWRNLAAGWYSSAFGVHSVTNGRGQFVVGEYNQSPPEVINDNRVRSSDYMFIVGNGRGDTARKNALTVQRDGTSTFKGKVVVEGELVLSQQNGDISMGIFGSN